MYLKSAYWHIPIALRFRQFLAIQMEAQVFQVTVLPFGLNIVLTVFTKMMKPVARALSHQGVEGLTYCTLTTGCFKHPPISNAKLISVLLRT